MCMRRNEYKWRGDSGRWTPADIRHTEHTMTSCVLWLSVFVFLCSPITGSDHTGVRVRVTNRAQDVLRDAGMILMRSLVNKPYKGLTITSLDIQNINIQFQDSLLQFVITDLRLAGRFNTSLSGGGRVSATIGVRLSKTQDGRLEVLMPKCELMSFNNINTDYTGQWSAVVGFLLNAAAWATELYPNWVCIALKWWVIPGVNTWLKNMTMMTILPKNLTLQMMLPETLDVKIDYSLSGDVEMTRNNIDVPFKGLMFCQDEPVVPGLNKTDPVFTENGMMAYVGISEFFFNSAAISIHGARAMQGAEQVKGGGEKFGLRLLQFFRQITRLQDPLNHEVEVTEVPTFAISQKDGLSVNVRARVRASATSPTAQPSPFLSVSARCQVSVKVAIEENRLTLPSDNINCKIITKNEIRENVVKPLNTFLTWGLKRFVRGSFNNKNGTGIPIPLPEGISFTQSKVDYHEGFLVVGGSLGWTPAGMQNLANLID